MSDAGRAAFPALGTTAVVLVDDPGVLAVARRAVELEVAAFDATCSRFRDDSELVGLNRRAAASARTRRYAVSALLATSIEVALEAAEATDGIVDPTLGATMRALGYDRTFSSVPPDGPALAFAMPRRTPWREVWVDRTTGTVMLPPGTQLDLGATAKALCADRAAAAAAADTGAGVLVSLGGDMAMAGSAPEAGWPVRVTDDHATDPLVAAGPVISLWDGGLATSGTTNRRWRRGEDVLHHVVDPRTGRPTAERWRTVTVAADSCVAANVASTAALVLGDAAPAWLEARDLPARLVGADGDLVLVGGWPADAEGKGQLCLR